MLSVVRKWRISPSKQSIVRVQSPKSCPPRPAGDFEDDVLEVAAETVPWTYPGVGEVAPLSSAAVENFRNTLDIHQRYLDLFR